MVIFTFYTVDTYDVALMQLQWVLCKQTNCFERMIALFRCSLQTHGSGAADRRAAMQPGDREGTRWAEGGRASIQASTNYSAYTRHPSGSYPSSLRPYKKCLFTINTLSFIWKGLALPPSLSSAVFATSRGVKTPPAKQKKTSELVPLTARPNIGRQTKPNSSREAFKRSHGPDDLFLFSAISERGQNLGRFSGLPPPPSLSSNEGKGRSGSGNRGEG